MSVLQEEKEDFANFCLDIYSDIEEQEEQNSLSEEDLNFVQRMMLVVEQIKEKKLTKKKFRQLQKAASKRR